jgi:hypothetical protein
MKKIAQAGTLERLTKFLNEYCYSTTYNINEDFIITNSKGVTTLFKVEKNSKGAFILYLNT